MHSRRKESSRVPIEFAVRKDRPKTVELIELGSFSVDCEELIVSDPCRKPDDPHIARRIIPNVVKGNWIGNAVRKKGYWGAVAFIDDPHERTIGGDPIGKITISSGICGIFNRTSYEKPSPKKFYGECSKLLQREEFGIAPFGILHRLPGESEVTIYRNLHDLAVGVAVIYCDKEHDPES